MRKIKKVHGPYTRKDRRKHVVIVFEDNSKRTVSYPKFLMEQHIGRELDPVKETIDHIDGDFTNDDLDNLRIIDRSTHAKEDAKYAKLITITCVWCGKKAKKKGNKLRHNSKQGKAGPFCGKSCAGKYGKAVQLGQIEKKPVQPSPESEYYYKDKTK